MVALSRLTATFEACLGLFRQNMKTLGCESRRGGMQKPRRRVRRTQPLPTMYSLQYTRRQKQLRTAENAWARAASVSVPYACRQSGPEASEKASLFGNDGDLVMRMQRNMDICGVCAWCHSLVSSQVQRWPCGYCPSIQGRRGSPFDVPCHCSFTQPNTCILSLASTAAGIPLSLMRTSSWMVWAGSCQPTLLVRKVFHSKLTKWRIWLPRKSSQMETEWG